MDKLPRVCVSLIVLQALTRLSISQAPSLSRALLSNYTINPSFHPSFPYCKFSGSPMPSISWSFNGERLPSDESEGGPYYNSGSGVLVLTNAHTGPYTCTGVNDLGFSSVSIEITITSSPAAPLYLMPYMYFVYALAAWGMCTVLIMILYCKKKRLVKHEQSYEDETYVNMYQVVDKTPPEWQPQLSTTEVYPVFQGTPEWNKIEQKFKATMPVSQIAAISRIQNTWLWGKYCNQWERLSTQHGESVCEIELFHGTRENDPKLIYEGEHGFDLRNKGRRLSSQVNCFATDASYSDTYSYMTTDSFKEILLVRVLISDSHRCDPVATSTDPPVQPTRQGSESGVNPQLEYNTMVTGETGGSQVFMTYDKDKAYPAYLIKYS